MAPVHYSIPEPIRWCELDDEWLVYLDRCGILSVLDPLGATVMSLAEEAPVTIESLARRLTEASCGATSAALLAQLDATLDELVGSGLLVSADQRVGR